MSFFAVLLALLLEQVKPLPRGNVVYDALTRWTAGVARNLDAGGDAHAWVVWLLTVAAPTLACWGVFVLAVNGNVLLGLAFDVAVLYGTLGFRQFSHYFTDIRDALEHGDETHARQLLAEWRHLDASDLPASELLRQVIEHSLLAAHRHVFGVFFWFVLLSTLGFGPAGAVLYRLAEFASRFWAHGSGGVAVNERLARFSERVFQALDYVPARMTAAGFAVVGNFEEAIACWRRDAVLWRHLNEGVILSAAAGAVGIRLGGSAPDLAIDRTMTFAAGASPGSASALGSTPGMPPVLGHLRSVVGLVWRSVVLWMLLLALLSLAKLVG